jgi:hypothetical protein
MIRKSINNQFLSPTITQPAKTTMNLDAVDLILPGMGRGAREEREFIREEAAFLEIPQVCQHRRGLFRQREGEYMHHYFGILTGEIQANDFMRNYMFDHPHFGQVYVDVHENFGPIQSRQFYSIYQDEEAGRSRLRLTMFNPDRSIWIDMLFM